MTYCLIFYISDSKFACLTGGISKLMSDFYCSFSTGGISNACSLTLFLALLNSESSLAVSPFSSILWMGSSTFVVYLAMIWLNMSLEVSLIAGLKVGSLSACFYFSFFKVSWCRVSSLVFIRTVRHFIFRSAGSPLKGDCMDLLMVSASIPRISSTVFLTS
jgi:hypothetical protein